MPPMLEGSRNVWIIATLFSMSHGFDLHLEDERGVRLAPRADAGRRRWRTNFGVEFVRVPAGITRFVQDAFKRHQAGAGPHHLIAKRIPLFMQAPPERSEDAWELDLERIVPRIVAPVSLAHRSWTPRPPFNLPIDVLAVGRAREYLYG